MIDLLKETKIKTSVLFIGAVLSQAAQAEVMLGKNFTSVEVASISSVIKEVEQVLPEEIRNKLPLIQIDKDVTRTGLSLMPLPICRGEKAQGDDQSDFTYAAYNHLTKKISVHPSVINEILKGPDVARSYNCGHRNSYLLARASLLHEIIHAYDYALPKKDSSASEYLYLARWKRTLTGIKNLNQKPDRSPDYYEYENIREHFAVNMEFFLLDPEYKCRRPGLYDYFSKKYKTVPFPEYACEGLTGIHRISDGLINYFDLAPE